MKTKAAMTGPAFLTWMAERHLTVAEAADQLGRTERTIYLYRNGEVPIPMVVAKLCQALPRPRRRA